MHRIIAVSGLLAVAASLQAQQIAVVPAADAAGPRGAGTASHAPLTGADAAALPPEAWAWQDPADSLWRAARQALDRGDNAAAAAAYRRIRSEARFAQSAYRSHAYYWEAFARHRIGTATELRAAQNLIGELRRAYPRFESMAEAERLSARITADLAARGDAQAASRAATAAAQASACPDQDMRAAAVESLISMPAEHAMPVLAQVMARKDECNARLRESAVWMIAQKGGNRAEDILLDAAKTDPSPKVREQAVFWLSRVNSDKAVDAIQEILRATSDPKVLEMSVFALSQHSSPRAAQLLRDIAGRPGASIETRKNAIFWLGRRGDAETGAFLRSAYGSTTDAGVKEAVIFALSQRTAENNSGWLLDVAMNPREPMEARKHALFWAGRQATLPLNRLAELYATMPDREMREQIVFAMSQRREPEALERLIEMARRETNADLRRTLLFWIGRSNDPRAARFLAEIIGG
jgi:HEAT repeat protein